MCIYQPIHRQLTDQGGVNLQYKINGHIVYTM
jgi:hypothetical protein